MAHGVIGKPAHLHIQIIDTHRLHPGSGLGKRAMTQAEHTQAGNGHLLAEGHFIYRQAKIAHQPSCLLHDEIVAQVSFRLTFIRHDEIVLPIR